MRKRTAHRWRLTVIMMVGVFFAAGSFWLVEVVNRAGQDEQGDPFLNEPDYIIDRFSLVRMSQTGQPAYIISGDKLTHRPVEDTSEIDKPYVHSLSGTQPPMQMHADSGRIDQGNTRVQLNGNVDVRRPATAQAPAMRLSTPALTVYPDEERMETASAVALELGQSSATGIGMKANNATRALQLGGRGQLVLPARPEH